MVTSIAGKDAGEAQSVLNPSVAAGLAGRNSSGMRAHTPGSSSTPRTMWGPLAMMPHPLTVPTQQPCNLRIGTKRADLKLRQLGV